MSYGPWGYGNSTTKAAESYAREMAALRQAVGMYNLLTSRAVVNTAPTRHRQVRNHPVAVQTQPEKRRARRPAGQSVPKRLTESEYNPATGVISWPPMLAEDERFAVDRARIDALFAQRTRSDAHPAGVPPVLPLDPRGGLAQRPRSDVHPAGVNSAEIRRTVDTMKTTLVAMLRSGQIDGQTYVAAKNFLQGLAYETRVASDPLQTSIAAN